jgi:hypothetical protein
LQTQSTNKTVEREHHHFSHQSSMYTALVLVAVLGVVLSARIADATSVPAYWGVHAQNQTTTQPGEISQASVAFSVFRTFFNWADIEFAPGQYNFSGQLAVVRWPRTWLFDDAYLMMTCMLALV